MLRHSSPAAPVPHSQKEHGLPPVHPHFNNSNSRRFNLVSRTHTSDSHKQHKKFLQYKMNGPLPPTPKNVYYPSRHGTQHALSHTRPSVTITRRKVSSSHTPTPRTRIAVDVNQSHTRTPNSHKHKEDKRSSPHLPKIHVYPTHSTQHARSHTSFSHSH